ncbi:FAD/FMN-containing dehydrogenase [Robiginitalea myxolifaciens]|uniref:FAD/FMN-containing dehydrogenase n=1 Tax=Robiginitalea myxolifaciens TaxID=400055 RepID=A0A1I6GZB0_9FLAO|nr:FAD-binding and (Fe-S)-binding domain-containing protein [Robiginitalea myxolifaciens]SFR47532.1 FAD/FMN-containing dehydrogenase [Robiginitalea myxolifaciens]
MLPEKYLIELRDLLQGELQWDELQRTLYATDASVYRIKPLGVAFPKNESDIQLLLKFAATHKIGLIPRTAGTSLAGQCVGPGLVVDVSKHMTRILELDEAKQQIKVQPGVVRDELNAYLKPFGLFFGPNTSTSNRCMIGGMAGNNSSGTTSIRYGVTRDKVVGMKILLSDGSPATIQPLDSSEFKAQTEAQGLEGEIYRGLEAILSDPSNAACIRSKYPNPEIHRRNTGYALDLLLETSPFGAEEPFNLAQLLCGSEGTLAFTTELTLQLDVLPPPCSAMIVPHYESLEGCLSDVKPVMEHGLYLCEMMDKVILDCTKNNREHKENRFFVDGDPAALLMLEVRAQDETELEQEIGKVLKTLEKSGYSYAHPVLYGDQIQMAISLRKAGLGLLGNMIGDKKAVACIEDTAVALGDLKPFIMEFTAIMDRYKQQAVYYAHAGAGELHLRPILNLKESEDVILFRSITTEVAKLTRKYNGSFSGEHGDGIVRAEFIPLLLGEQNYELLKSVKALFDPNRILNPGKIVDALPMDRSLRYEPDREEPEIETLFDFSDNQGILRAAEKCNGSGDCRKSHQMPGAMCPSYQATKNEKDTTRGRANTLREFLTHSESANRFDHKELKEVYDLCLSCKACARECPSNVDVATLKAEMLYQYQEKNGYSLRSKMFAHSTRINALNSRFAGLSNAVLQSKIGGGLVKKLMGVAPERKLPAVSNFNFNSYLQKQCKAKDVASASKPGQKVALYIDEFTRYLDVDQGRDAIDLLLALGYEVELFYADSGRTYISKGFLEEARALAHKNKPELLQFARQHTPLLGLEPSAILTFRDEYKRFGLEQSDMEAIAGNCFLIEEFLAAEIASGKLNSELFTREERTVKIHNHCYQKALSDQKITFDILNLPVNYKVSIIPSGCCGMAGSFGYEKEHYQVSMQVGSLKLFPAIEKTDKEVILAANGTSCRHQINDGTGRKAKHPVTILKEALL